MPPSRSVPGWALSFAVATRTQRLRSLSFFRLAHVTVYRVANDAIRDLLQVLLELRRERDKFRPQAFVKAVWRNDLHGAEPLTVTTKRAESVSTAKRHEQLPLPRVRD